MLQEAKVRNGYKLTASNTALVRLKFAVLIYQMDAGSQVAEPTKMVHFTEMP
jgi:hypothetical protein